MSAKIDEAKRESEAIRSDISVLNTRLDRIKAAREEEEAKLNDIRQAQQDARSDIPALNVEKKELWEVCVLCLPCIGAVLPHVLDLPAKVIPRTASVVNSNSQHSRQHYVLCWMVSMQPFAATQQLCNAARHQCATKVSLYC